MMTEEQRLYAHARRDFKSFHVDKAQKLIDAADAAVEAAMRKVKETEQSLEELRPVWAHGWTSDSVAAQASANALAQLWKILDVDNQTDAVARLSRWAERFNP